MKESVAAVDAIIRDLSLGGLDHAWDAISDEDREVIRLRWTQIVEQSRERLTTERDLARHDRDQAFARLEALEAKEPR